ncbi:MAG: hypothetical protein K2M96_10080 [Prevotella sp.]|nr:hypothetical protein [Prevotella sp.]
MKIKETHTYKLLVEGNDDQHVVWALCQKHSVPETFDVLDCGSVENVLKEFKLRLQLADNNHRIGIVVDADVNMKSRWEKVVSILKNTGKYDCDNIVLPKDGLVLESRDKSYPKIGIWLMPDNNQNGMLEDFMASLAAPGDALMKKSEDVLTEIENEGIQKYKPAHRSKAKIHAYLAWQDVPGHPMGQAITANILDSNSDSDVAVKFAKWLKEIFN